MSFSLTSESFLARGHKIKKMLFHYIMRIFTSTDQTPNVSNWDASLANSKRKKPSLHCLLEEPTFFLWLYCVQRNYQVWWDTYTSMWKTPVLWYKLLLRGFILKQFAKWHLKSHGHRLYCLWFWIYHLNSLELKLEIKNKYMEISLMCIDSPNT